MKTARLLSSGALALSLLAGSVTAAVSPDRGRQARQQPDPIGAQKEGNADGSIPAWTGGLAASAEQGRRQGLPFRSLCRREPLFTITAQNVEQYRTSSPTASWRCSSATRDLPDPGVQDPSHGGPAGRDRRGGQAERAERAADQRRQRPVEFREEPLLRLPDSEERRRSALEPHHPLPRRQPQAHHRPGHPADQRQLHADPLRGVGGVPAEHARPRPEQGGQHPHLLQAAGDRAGAPGGQRAAGP